MIDVSLSKGGSMNKIFSIFAIATLLMLASMTTPAGVKAATPIVQVETMQIVAENEDMNASSAPSVSEYALPYPGILPDHPLYVFKKLRDQILERLISDPVRKMEFYMLQADKGVNTAVFLAAKQQDTLADASLVQAQGSLRKALDLAKELKEQKREVPPHMVERFGNALAKYETVMMEMAATSSEERKAVMAMMITSLKTYQADIDALQQ
jgi:hypothetical protein